MVKKVITLCFLIFLCGISVSLCTEEEAFTRVISETLIAQIDPSPREDLFFSISPNNKRVAYVARETNKDRF